MLGNKGWFHSRPGALMTTELLQQKWTRRLGLC